MSWCGGLEWLPGQVREGYEEMDWRARERAVAPTPNRAQALQADRLRLPGMLPPEVLTWKAWLALHEAQYDSFDYSQRVAPGYDLGPAWPDNVRTIAVTNSQNRIDVGTWQGKLATLIEVKDRAGASALGQLLTYCPLWSAQHTDLPRAQMLLVSNRIQPGIDAAAARHGVKVEVIPVDFSILKSAWRAPPFMATQRKSVVYL